MPIDILAYAYIYISFFTNLSSWENCIRSMGERDEHSLKDTDFTSIDSKHKNKEIEVNYVFHNHQWRRTSSKVNGDAIMFKIDV